MEAVSEDQKPSRPRRTRIPLKTKVTEPSQDIAKRKRTFDDFFNFCNFVLAYEEQLAASSPLRGSNSAGESSHSSTPSQSSESSSGPELSEDEDPSMEEPPPSSLQSPEGITDRLEYTSDDESWNLVTCFCRRPFAGRPMIECTSCKTWVHLFCAKIKKDQVPDIYYCPRCRATGSRKEKRRKMIQPED